LTKKVNTHEAKTRLSRLLRRVAAGEEITIANRGVPVARLVPVRRQKPMRKLGAYGDTIKIADDFDAPLLDTSVLIRSLISRPKLNHRALILLADTSTELYLILGEFLGNHDQDWHREAGSAGMTGGVWDPRDAIRVPTNSGCYSSPRVGLVCVAESSPEPV